MFYIMFTLQVLKIPFFVLDFLPLRKIKKLTESGNTQLQIYFTPFLYILMVFGLIILINQCIQIVKSIYFDFSV